MQLILLKWDIQSPVIVISLKEGTSKQAAYELFGMFCQHRSCCCYLRANPEWMNHQLWLPKVKYVQSWFWAEQQHSPLCSKEARTTTWGPELRGPAAPGRLSPPPNRLTRGRKDRKQSVYSFKERMLVLDDKTMKLGDQIIAFCFWIASAASKVSGF